MAWFAKRSAADENDDRHNLILKRLRRAILEREDSQGKSRKYIILQDNIIYK
jgi:hypothetical protein